MFRALLCMIGLCVASPAFAAGDDTSLGTPEVVSTSIEGWKLTKLGADVQIPLTNTTIISVVSGTDSGGALISGTNTRLTTTSSGTVVRGYAVDHGIVAASCSVTLGQLVTLQATGYNLKIKNLLTTCLGGT